jgi:hypothetical protein
MTGRQPAQLHGWEQRAPVARELAARYRNGESIRTIAASIGRSYCYVWHMLNQAGVQFRGRGGAHPRRPKESNR